jgi:hypothetical protein
MNENELEVTNETDEKGNPTGGTVHALGLTIDWQAGPRRDVINGELRDRNGVFVEDVIEAAKQRLEFFQTATNGKFACRENALAITKLEEALHWLDHRTKARQARGVEGMNLA